MKNYEVFRKREDFGFVFYAIGQGWIKKFETAADLYEFEKEIKTSDAGLTEQDLLQLL